MRSTPTPKEILRTVKVLTGAGTAHADDIALEDLDALAVALLDAVVNLDVVADANLRDVLADLLALDGADVVHFCS